MIIAIKKLHNIKEIPKSSKHFLSELNVKINKKEKEHRVLTEEYRETFRKIELDENKYIYEIGLKKNQLKRVNKYLFFLKLNSLYLIVKNYTIIKFNQ